MTIHEKYVRLYSPGLVILSGVNFQVPSPHSCLSATLYFTRPELAIYFVDCWSCWFSLVLTQMGWQYYSTRCRKGKEINLIGPVSEANRIVITIASLAAPGCGWVGFSILFPYTRKASLINNRYFVIHQNYDNPEEVRSSHFSVLVILFGVNFQVPSPPSCLSASISRSSVWHWSVLRCDQQT